MALLPKPVESLAKEFGNLPSIGLRSSERLAFFCANLTKNQLEEFAFALQEVSKKIHPCKLCNFFAEDDLCEICKNPKRDVKTLCVVEQPQDLLALEKAEDYFGLYYILGGSLSPLDGIGPNELRLPNLKERILKEGIEEVILALNPDVEGDITASYIASLFEDSGLKVTKPATGLPAGGSFQYADSLTLKKAMAARRPVD